MNNRSSSRDYEMMYTTQKKCPYCGCENVEYINTVLGEGRMSEYGKISMPILNIFECRGCKDAEGKNKEFIFLGKPVDEK